MESLACLNGELMPVDQARVPVWDRGFLFGDAVYEALRIYQGCCWLEDEHFARLRRSLAELHFPVIDIDRLIGRLHRTISASAIEDGIAYLQITRGVAPRAHAFPDPPVAPTELIIIREFDDTSMASLRQEGAAAISQPDLRWGRCDIKSTNLLANVLAQDAARRAGCYEAILIGHDGHVTEATHTSVLWVRAGRLEATPEGPEILPGTTRQFLLRVAREIGVPATDGSVTLDELIRASEVLLVGTTCEVVPVVRIDSQPIADGRPGPIARRLQEAYRAAVEQWLAPQPV
jgi:D-alanine transaminase